LDASSSEHTNGIHARSRHWAWALGAVVCIAFGVMGVEFAFAVRADRPGWWVTLQAAVAGDDYSLGVGSPHGMYPIYRRSLAALTSHTTLGGLALGLGALQFMPSLRRRHRTLHRAAGAGVILAVGCSMTGALTYLVATPLAEAYAGPAFGFALWALALACLTNLVLAVLSIWRRDFRSHMGFMALMMATLLTAPTLRFGWALFGVVSSFDIATVNQGTTTFLVLWTILTMALWMHRVGAADLPARKREAVLSPVLMTTTAWMTVVVVAHESLLSPVGIDLLAGWRHAHERLPLVAAIWGLPTMLLAWRAPSDIAAVIAGERIGRRSKALAVLAATGAFAIAAQHSRHAVDAVAMVFFWNAFGATLLALVAAGTWSRRNDEPWTLTWLFLALTAGQWPLLWFIVWMSGHSFTIAMWFACALGPSITVTYAFLSAFAIRMPFGERTVPSAASRVAPAASPTT